MLLVRYRLMLALLLVLFGTSLVFSSAAHAESKSSSTASINMSCPKVFYHWSSGGNQYWYLNDCLVHQVEDVLNTVNSTQLVAALLSLIPSNGWWGAAVKFMLNSIPRLLSYDLWLSDRQCNWRGIVVVQYWWLLYSPQFACPA